MALTKGLGGGGGGGSATTLKDEGSTLTGGLTSLDVVGSGATASVAGTAGTITVPGGLLYLATVTASAAASADFTSLITSTYDEYELVSVGLTMGTNGRMAAIQLSTNNGSSWITSGYEYGIKLVGNSTNFETYQRGTAQSGAAIGSALMSSSVVSTLITKLFRANTSERKTFVSEGIVGASDGNTYGVFSTSSYPTASPFDAFRVLDPAGGTITGTFRLYARVKS